MDLNLSAAGVENAPTNISFYINFFILENPNLRNYICRSTKELNI